MTDTSPEAVTVFKQTEKFNRQRALLTPTQIQSEESIEKTLSLVPALKVDTSVIEKLSKEKSQAVKLPKQTSHLVGVRLHSLQHFYMFVR